METCPKINHRGVGWDVDVPSTCLALVWAGVGCSCCCQPSAGVGRGGGWGGMLTSPLPAYLWFGLGLDVHEFHRPGHALVRGNQSMLLCRSALLWGAHRHSSAKMTRSRVDTRKAAKPNRKRYNFEQSEYYKVLAGTTKYYRVLQGTTRYYKVIEGTTR